MMFGSGFIVVDRSMIQNQGSILKRSHLDRKEQNKDCCLLFEGGATIRSTLSYLEQF